MTTKKSAMQQSTALNTSLDRQLRIFEKVKMWISAPQDKTINSWIIEQLRIQPYQHILEVGYGSGSALHEIAKKLPVGFLAGIDDSVNHYQQAGRKNKRIIEDGLLCLHLGSVEQLPYPANYFDSIYAGDIYYSWNEPQYKFMQLHRLLKSGGKLITLVKPPRKSSEKDFWDEAEKIQQQYREAGFLDVRFAFREMHAANAISVVGYQA